MEHSIQISRAALSTAPARGLSVLLLLALCAAIGGHGNAAAQNLNVDSLMQHIQIDTLWYSGGKDNRINIAYINRGSDFNGYTAGMKDEYLSDVRHTWRAWTPGDSLAFAPYAQYRNFFNLFALWLPDAPSSEEGFDWYEVQSIRDRLFLPWTGTSGWVTILSMPNGRGGGGGAGLQRNRRVGDITIHGNDIETIVHEFSHTAPGLSDEYTSSGEWGGGACPADPNTQPHVKREDISWRAWIDDATPLPTPYEEAWLGTVGAFQGGRHNYFGCYRPTARSCVMGAGDFVADSTFCAPCRQWIIKRLYDYVNAIENPQPAETELRVDGAVQMSFSVDVLAPEPNTQKYEWYLNGALIADGRTNVLVDIDVCNDYELRFVLTDTTRFIRHDPPFIEFPQQEFVWHIDQLQVSAYSLSAGFSTVNTSCAGDSDGQITVQAAGGTAPYSYYYYYLPELSRPELLAGSGADAAAIEGLPAGEYHVIVLDANGCSVRENVSVGADNLLVPDLRAEYRNGAWDLNVYPRGYKETELTYAWSTGAQGDNLLGMADGAYWVDVQARGGCTVRESAELIAPAMPLAVEAVVIPSRSDAASGAVWLHIDGGRAPYAIEWHEDAPDGGAKAVRVVSNDRARSGLAAGQYVAVVKDANKTARTLVVSVGQAAEFTAELQVLQSGYNSMALQNPDARYNYLWYAARDADEYIHAGNTFRPERSGTYYVAAQQVASGALSANRRGFTITLEAAPEVVNNDDKKLLIANPAAERQYYWYAEAEGGAPLAEGPEYVPGESGVYYAAARSARQYPEPVAPDATAAELVFWLDAADLDGDGYADDPAPPSASHYDWKEKAGGNAWETWFAYESNWQNGNGIARFATIWLQWLREPLPTYQSVMLAYDENGLSWPGSAPFQSMRVVMKRPEGNSQLFADDVSDRTHNGAVYLNGKRVDPFTTPNPMNFCVLSLVLSAPVTATSKYCDNFWEGDMGEMLLWSGPLSESDRAGVEEYLRRKWITSAELESPRTMVQFGDPTVEVREEPHAPGAAIAIRSVTAEGAHITLPQAGVYTVALYDLRGALLWSAQRRSATPGTELCRFDASAALAAGVYILAVEQGAARIARQVVLLR